MVRSRIPADLRGRPQWVTWRLEQREGRSTKVPYSVATGGLASSTDPATWTTFDKAARAAKAGGYSGIGYVFSEDDPYTGIDLDHVRETGVGALDPVASEIVARLRSYTEVTQSGSGLHVIVRAKLHGSRHRTRLLGATRDDAGIELYDSGRFFVMTGDHLPGTPTTIEDREAEVATLYAEIFPAPDRSHENGSGTIRAGGNGLSDEEVLARMFTSRSEPRIRPLWDGEAKPGDGSSSAADLALCSHLAYWTNRDAAQMDRLFRQSRLFRDKWDSPRGDTTYGAQTIARAIAGTREGFDPNAGATRPSESATLRTWTVADLIGASEVDPPEMLVEGMVAEGDRFMIYGFAGVGKSMIALDLAFAIHRGAPFLGHFQTTKAKVGYIDEESAPPRLGQRLAMLARGHEIDPTSVDLPLFNVQADHRLDNDAGVKRLHEWIKEHGLDAVVLDTLRRAHRLRENEADDMAKIEIAVKSLQLRSRELGRPLTVLLLHHAPKPRSGGGSSAPETMARGSSDIVGWVDGALYLHGRDALIQVDHAKARWTEQLKPFVVEIQATPTTLRLVHAGAVVTKQSKGQQLRALIQRLLIDGPLSQSEIVAKAKAEGISRDRSITDEIRAMVKDAELKAEKSGRFTNYSLTSSPMDEEAF